MVLEESGFPSGKKKKETKMLHPAVVIIIFFSGKRKLRVHGQEDCPVGMLMSAPKAKAQQIHRKRQEHENGK